MNRPRLWVWSAVVAFSVIPVGARAQQSGSSPSGPVRFSGELGVQGELYGISGAARRRTPSVASMFFRPTLALSDVVSLNMDFLLSTDGSSARQSISQIGLHPDWGWGQAHVGSFSESFSEHSVAGVRVTGGGVTLNPGILRLAALGGSTQRATSDSTRTRAFHRDLWGGRIGLGKEGGSFFDLVYLRVKDDASSLVPLTGSIPPPGSTSVPTPDVTPQENMVAGINMRLFAFGHHMTWENEAMGAVHTRDLRAPVDSALRLPDAVKNVYSPNNSSHGDVAFTSSVTVALPSLNVRSSYAFVGPGYESLALGSQANDMRELSINPSYNARAISVSGSYLRSSDNTRDQKVTTTTRTTYGGTASFQPLRSVSSSVSAMYLTLANGAPADSGKLDFLTLSLSTSQSVIFPSASIVKSLGLNVSFQKSQDHASAADTRSKTRSLSLFSAMSPRAGLTLVPNISLTSTTAGSAASASTNNYALQMQYRPQRSTVGVSATTSLTTAAESSKSYRNSGTVSMNATPNDSVALSASLTSFRAGMTSGTNFNERRGSLSYSHRF